jgi:hypothetical protein
MDTPFDCPICRRRQADPEPRWVQDLVGRRVYEYRGVDQVWRRAAPDVVVLDAHVIYPYGHVAVAIQIGGATYWPAFRNVKLAHH